MSCINVDPPLIARNGVLRALGITRISTVNQDVQSLADQQALLRKWLKDRYDGPVQWQFIEGQGSGECIDSYKDWQLHAYFAAMKHEQSNKDTSARIKRSQRNRFQ